MANSKRTFRYWYKAVNSDIWRDITSQIQKAKGDKYLNKSNSFTINLSAPMLDDEYISINEGDRFAVFQDPELNILIAEGMVDDTGREFLTYDRSLSKIIYKYSIRCIENNFGDSPVSAFSVTDTLSSDILTTIFSYASEELTGEKFRLNINDFTVKAFSSPKRDIEGCLTDFCNQLGLFWKKTKSATLDDDYGLIFDSFIDIFDERGISVSNSSWSSGLEDKHYYSAFAVQNNKLANSIKYPYQFGEVNFRPKTDTTIIVNHLEVKAKIYADDTADLSSLQRWATPAQFNKFEYELPDPASSIIYAAYLVQSSCLASSTTTVIKLASRDAVTIEEGNTVRVINSNDINSYTIENFRTVTNVNVLDTLTTEITLDSALSFSPSTGYIFEVVDNVNKYEDIAENENKTGLLYKLQNNQNAKVRFTELAEPPPGVDICIYYKRITSSNLELINDESKKRYGMRYESIDLSDDDVTTREELNNRASKFLILKPNRILSFTSYRYDVPDLGLPIPVNITDLFEEQDIFLVQQISWEDLTGVDASGEIIPKANITLSTMRSSLETLIKRFKNSRKVSTTSESKSKKIQQEKINVKDYFTYSISIITAKDWNYSGFTNGFYLNFENSDLTDKTGLESPSGTISGYTSDTWYGRKAVIFNGISDVIYVNNSHMSNDTSYDKLLLEAQFELSDNLSNGQTMILFSRERYFGSGIGEFRMGLYKTAGLTYISADFYNADYSPNFFCRLQNQINFVKDTKYSLIYSVDFQNKYQTCNVNKTNYSGSMLDVGLKSFADFNYIIANRSGGTSTKIGREGYSDADKYAGKLWRVLLTLGTFKNSTIADSEQERFGF